MNTSRINIRKNKEIVCLSFLLFLQILLDFIKVLLRGGSSTITYVVYIVSLFLILYVFRRNISIKSIGLISLFYGLFGISYLLFPETRLYYSGDSFILLCVYFLPIVFLVIRRIRNWDNFFAVMSWFGIASVVMGLYIVFFSGVDNYSSDERFFTYMEFSYAQLPFVCSLYKNARDKKSLVFFAICALGFFEILAFGSRATVLFALLFILLVEFISRLTSVKGMFVFGILLFVVLIGFDSIIEWLATVPALRDSYVMRHLLSGELFLYDSRETIYESCRNRINTMGLDVSGFFGDRRYCGSVYPHNIIYEVLMQWGWVFGMPILIYLAFLILRAFSYRTNYAIVVFLICCLFGRYFVSGTYVTEGRFWIFYGCLLALTSKTIKTSYE